MFNLWKVCAKWFFFAPIIIQQGNSEITVGAGGSPEKKRLKVDPEGAEKDAPQKLENL